MLSICFPSALSAERNLPPPSTQGCRRGEWVWQLLLPKRNGRTPLRGVTGTEFRLPVLTPPERSSGTGHYVPGQAEQEGGSGNQSCRAVGFAPEGCKPLRR